MEEGPCSVITMIGHNEEIRPKDVRMDAVRPLSVVPILAVTMRS